ncbi:MAG: DUF58 domain-containing protein [Actinomycetota bacterium]
MTRLGVGAAVAGSSLTVAGLALGWPAITRLGIVVVCLVVFAFAYALRRPKVRVVRHVHPPRVSRGLDAIAYVEVTNLGRRRVGRLAATQPFGTRTVPLVLPTVEPNTTETGIYRLPTERRGIFTLEPIELTRSDPFELVRLTQRHGRADDLWVHPRVVPLRALPSGATRHLEGPTSDTSPQGSITFHRIREYVAGDDRRMIHWRSTARSTDGTLMVRQNVDTSQPYTVVVVDLVPTSYSEASFELAIDIAASVVTTATTGKSPVELRVSAPGPGTTIGERIGGNETRDPQLLVDYLTGVGSSPDGSLAAELLRLRRDRGGTALVVVTGDIDDTTVPAAAALGRRFERIVVTSVTDERRPVAALTGVTVINATDLEEFARAWNLQVRP